MALSKCCDSYVLRDAVAKSPKEGRFYETHTCPTCKRKMKILFEGNRTMGDDEIHCSALSAEYVN